MAAELLPCPFCGSSVAKLVMAGGYWKIRCDCGANLSGYATRQYAANIWNRRPDAPRFGAERECERDGNCKNA